MANLIANISSSIPSSTNIDNERDPISHFHIGNRLISKDAIDLHMKGRRLISIENLMNYDSTNFAFNDEDWVTFGVVHKINHSRTQSGKEVLYFQVTDLKDCYISVFLNGNSNQYISIPTGGVIYLINPNIIPSRDGNQKLALSIPSIQYIKFIGRAVDYGICQGTQRNNAKCTNAVNLEISRYCMYHIRKTQNVSNTFRSEISCEMMTTNIQRNNMSEGRFQLGKECIDCRPLSHVNQIDLSQYGISNKNRTKIVNGIPIGGSLGARMQAKLVEEDKHRKLEEERNRLLKRQREMESKENEGIPYLGRGLLPGKIIRLDTEEEKKRDRDMKIAEIKRRLQDANISLPKTYDPMKSLYINKSPTHIRDVSSTTPSPIQPRNTSTSTSDSSVRQIISGADLLPMHAKTGNAIFDAILESTSGDKLESKKNEVLSKKGLYAEQELRDELRVLKERQEQQDRKEEMMQNMMSLEVTCYWCAQCQKYVENGPGRDLCESQGHFLERRRETKRMFECMSCHAKRGFICVEIPVRKCVCGCCLWRPCSFHEAKTAKMDKMVITTPSNHILYCHDIKSKSES